MHANRQELIEAIREYLKVHTWSERENIVKAHPELLTDEADELMKEELFVTYRANPTEGERTEVLRRILLRSREVGVEQAFREMQRMMALHECLAGLALRSASEEERYRYVQTYPLLLSPDADAMLQDTSDPAWVKIRGELIRYREPIWANREAEFERRRQEFAEVLAFYEISPATLPPIPAGPTMVCTNDPSHRFIHRAGVRHCPYCGAEGKRESRTS